MAINIVDPDHAGLDHVDSYWAATAGPHLADAPSIAGDIDVEIAIVGGGYTGLSAAYHLARIAGVEAHVLEANRIGWGCSGRNGGFVLPGIGKGDMRGWIRRWGRDQARAIFDQSRDAVRLVRDLLQNEAIEADRTQDGYLEIAHKPQRMSILESEQRFLADEFGMTTRLIDRATLERDFFVSRESHGALLHEEAFGLNALRFARGLAVAARRQGAKLHERTAVVEWSREGKWQVLRTTGGRVRARTVVIATNGYGGDRLHPCLAGRLLPVLSNIIVTRPLSPAERDSLGWQTHLPISDTRNMLFYYRLLPDNRILFGARGEIEDTPETRARRRAWLQRRLIDMFPATAGIEIEYFWSGWVCIAFDMTPHVGTAEDGTIHYALGYAGTGVAMATYCGMLLAHAISGKPGPRPSLLLSLPLRRFPMPDFRRFYQRAAYLLYELKDWR